MTETDLVRGILSALAWRRDVAVWRQNTGAVSVGDGARKRFVRFGYKGFADISGIGPGGVRIEIECKVERGVQSDAQKAFEAMIRQHGGIYFVARSVDDCLRQLDRALAALGPQPPQAA